MEKSIFQTIQQQQETENKHNLIKQYLKLSFGEFACLYQYKINIDFLAVY